MLYLGIYGIEGTTAHILDLQMKRQKEVGSGSLEKK